MNRPIKFRAWDKESKYFVNVFEDADYTLAWDYTGNIYVVKDGNPMPDKYELVEWIGLTDKNGKEIYEGDVVKYKLLEQFDNEESERTDQVQFLEKWAGWWPMVYDYECDDGFYSHKVQDVEVIGNIYENPDLLTTPSV